MVQFFPSSSIGIGTRFYENWINDRMLLGDHWEHIWRECVIPSPTWMTRKSDLKEIGGFNDLQYPEDYFLAFKFYSENFQVKSLGEIIHFWRQHPERYSGKSDHYSADNFMKLRWCFFKKTILNGAIPVIIGTGDKAKLLLRILNLEKLNFIVISDKHNSELKSIESHPLLFYKDYTPKKEHVLISTLSSIDSHSELYRYFEEKAVKVYKFC
jgi:hypothetical protein